MFAGERVIGFYINYIICTSPYRHLLVLPIFYSINEEKFLYFQIC